MSIVTEDGTAKTDSETLVSVTDADTYHSNRGNDSWADLDTPVKEQCLRKATDTMQSMYRLRWKGGRKTSTQALDWPRVGCYIDEPIQVDYASALHVATTFPYLIPSTIVPPEVKNACAELALKAATVTLMPDQTRAVLMERVGPLETQYDKASPQQTQYAFIDALLSPLLLASGGAYSVGLIRT